MWKKIFLGALVAISTFGIFSISEAHRGDNYDCRDGYCHRENYCCGNYYCDENYENNYCGRKYCY